MAKRMDSPATSEDDALLQELAADQASRLAHKSLRDDDYQTDASATTPRDTDSTKQGIPLSPSAKIPTGKTTAPSVPHSHDTATPDDDDDTSEILKHFAQPKIKEPISTVDHANSAAAAMIDIIADVTDYHPGTPDIDIEGADVPLDEDDYAHDAEGAITLDQLTEMIEDINEPEEPVASPVLGTSRPVNILETPRTSKPDSPTMSDQPVTGPDVTEAVDWMADEKPASSSISAEVVDQRELHARRNLQEAKRIVAEIISKPVESEDGLVHDDFADLTVPRESTETVVTQESQEETSPLGNLAEEILTQRMAAEAVAQSGTETFLDEEPEQEEADDETLHDISAEETIYRKPKGGSTGIAVGPASPEPSQTRSLMIQLLIVTLSLAAAAMLVWLFLWK